MSYSLKFLIQATPSSTKLLPGLAASKKALKIFHVVVGMGIASEEVLPQGGYEKKPLDQKEILKVEDFFVSYMWHTRMVDSGHSG
ncbi:hypothetical protein AJ79_00626 [Helicocarpus griseus UAMH5409]|uniref:Uncharacterized protein n=1 Tax=Helicocarpus griseus UAMH5409 TaxID=1447875 RepID=A0A2B7YCG5_9EURO|nr:hypothetical protein AJ79_00626 [Helicocarpus griseus UAMH5409]